MYLQLAQFIHFSFFSCEISSRVKVTHSQTCRRASHSSELRAVRCAGDCSKNRILLGFVAQKLVVEGYGVAFRYGSGSLEKTGFCEKREFRSVEDMFTFSYACAIQIKFSINEMLKNTVLENIGYWKNEF